MTTHFERFDHIHSTLSRNVDASDCTPQPVTFPEPLRLLDDLHKFSIKEIQDSIRLFRIYAKDYHIQHL